MSPYTVLDPTGEYISLFFMIALFVFSNFLHFTPSLKNRVFKILRKIVFLGILLGVLNAHVLNNSSLYNDFFISLISHLFFLFIPIMITLFALFAYYYINDSHDRISKRHLIYFSPTLIVCLYIAGAFLLNVVINYNVVDYHIDYIYFSLGIYYLILLSVQISSKAIDNKFELHVISYTYSILMIIAFITYNILPKVLLSGSIATLSTMILLFFLQTRENTLDTVTNLPGRHSLNSTLLYYTKKSTVQEIGIILISMSNLSEINDKFGYTVGDALLRRFSDFLTKHFSRKNTFRYTNTEFVIVLTEEEQHSYRSAIEVIEKRVKESWIVNGDSIDIDCSFATMEYPSKLKSYEDIITVLDFYTSKSKNVLDKETLYISDSILAGIKKRNAIIQELRKNALEDTVSIEYQPIYSLQTTKVVSIEALMRLNIPILGSISPDEFIPIAEETYLILKLGKLLFAKACNLISKLEANKIAFDKMSINISSIQLFDEDFIEDILNIIYERNVSASKIKLELTESILIVNYEKLSYIINRLKECGFSISLDDYGTGYSNYVKLARLPFDEIKIDKSILYYVSHNKDEYDNLFNIVKAFKKRGITIVMEGVESENQLELSKSILADLVQGYYYSRPLNEKDLLQKLKDH